MGVSRWDPSDWSSHTARTAGKSRSRIFASRGLNDALDPKGVVMRESRDSAANPASTPIIVGLDVTGSMGMIPDALVRDGLGTMIEETLTRKPVTDPHLMLMGIGDANYDRAPLQVTQFEADIRIAEQLQNIYLEGGGGGNASESYNLPWYFAAMHTSTDAYEKRGRKGYLFTVGDEEPPQRLVRDQISRVIGDDIESDALSDAELIAAASRMYNVFHIVVQQGHHYRLHGDRVDRAWRELLGQRVIPLSDYTRLPEVIVSTIQVCEGENADTVAHSWSGDTALVVRNATRALSADGGDTGRGVVRL